MADANTPEPAEPADVPELMAARHTVKLGPRIYTVDVSDWVWTVRSRWDVLADAVGLEETCGRLAERGYVDAVTVVRWVAARIAAGDKVGSEPAAEG